ncbi:SPOR domain-containing protein [Hydrogenobacter sp. T-2]|uniref:SPOR domain-containing protein n=1 Tax=Pampinifervens diazotrophicum TaxID=1632018 RepID=UPI002B25AF3C|nr:SPOR domain-containing protein [Hydrogenobacter sp. T-2]WPM31861.1 SPOR domain-containing protein [Hydrogenobacter sp. T-2]
MKRERLVILLGVLVALVFFYLGLNEWLKTKEEQVQPPPLVVQPSPQREEAPQAQQTPASAELEPKAEVKKQEGKQETKEAPKTKEQDVIAQKIREEKRIEPSQKAKEEKGKEKPQEVRESKEAAKATLKTYTVQIGAFANEEGAKKTAERARKMGYRVNIVEEDNFYKVRVLVRTDDINSELRKLRGVFGGAIVKQ